MDQNTYYPPDSDLDLSFTSCATTSTSTSTLTSSSARSSLTLSFNDPSRLSTSTSNPNPNPNPYPRPHRSSDPHWSAITLSTNLSSDNTLHLHHLKLLRHLGSGNLGRVFLCRLRHNQHLNFALKVVDTQSISSKKLSHIETEARILSSLDHPFLPTLYAHLQVSHYSCLLIDYCPNGDLHSLLRQQPHYRLPVATVRFFAAEVLVALEYLHALGVVYRDLKPENILIREDGHIMLSDFDLCFNAEIVPKLETNVKLGSTKTVTEFVAEPTAAFSRSCVGTHEYLAPEIVAGNGHGAGIDWWAFGVLIYELLYGTTPFKGGSKESTLRIIGSTRGVRFEGGIEEEGIGEAKDLIEGLLVKDPRRRLGCTRGAQDIKRHPFFDGVKWPLIRNYRPPEVRGIAVRKSRAHVSHVSGMLSPKRRRWWRKGISCIMTKSKGSKRNLNSNHNYYCYTNDSGRKCD